MATALAAVIKGIFWTERAVEKEKVEKAMKDINEVIRVKRGQMEELGRQIKMLQEVARMLEMEGEINMQAGMPGALSSGGTVEQPNVLIPKDPGAGAGAGATMAENPRPKRWP